MLKIGSQGARVLALEQQLKASGDLKGPANEKFDRRTAAAVVAWKRENGWEDPKPQVGGKMAAMLHLPKKGESGFETPKTMRGATYNAKIGRDPQVVKKVVSDFLKNRKLDFMQVQEISGYDQVLSKIPGYKLITFRSSKDHGETGVLVKDSILAREAKSVEAATGWTNVHGRPAQPRAATSVQLAGWLRVVSVHAPPGIDWVNGVPRGGDQRIKSYQSLSKKLVAHVRRSNEAVLIGGDWNEGARTGGPGSPSWIAAKATMKKHANGRIDWEMTRGAKLTNMHVGQSGGSDHRIVAFTISRPR